MLGDNDKHLQISPSIGNSSSKLEGNLSFTCFSMFVYIRCLFHSALIGQNIIVQLRGAKRSTEGGFQIPET